MTVNKVTLDLIKEWEGCKLTAYQDIVGVWTIGYGTTAAAGLGITPVKGMTITQQRAEDLLRQGVEEFATKVDELITAIGGAAATVIVAVWSVISKRRA